MSTPNNLNRIPELDADNMLGHIDALPDQLEAAWARAHELELPFDTSGLQQVVISGMGGSAISGDLLATLVAPVCPIPVVVYRGYDLPAYATGPGTLVVALSHSGGTEEVLSVARQAAARGARLLAITSGGELAEFAGEAGGTVWTFEYDAQPRASLGWLYGLLLGAFSRLGLAGSIAGDVEQTVAAMQRVRATLGPGNPSQVSPAQHLAEMLAGRIPVVWGAEVFAPVARRWKTQLNENSKSVAFYDTLPELNHNTVAGLDFPAGLTENIAVVELVSLPYAHPRIARRQQVTRTLLDRAGIAAFRVEAQGSSALAQQMNLVQFGDYVSYYLAIHNEVDPTPIDNIVWLKEQLGRD